MPEGFRSPRKIARRLKLLPSAARCIRNWPQFMFHYLLGLVPDFPYRFRNGARLQIDRGVDHVPIIEIFIRGDYGTVADGAVVLDLGANIGTFSVYAATSAKKVTVYAYEPVAQYFRRLRQNIQLNGLDSRIRCFDVAVAGSNETRELFLEPPNRLFPSFVARGGNPGRSVRVSCTTLAEIIAANEIERVDILKLDCEGSEYDILYNAAPDVLDRIAEIRLEYHELGVAGCNSSGLRAFLESHNFVIIRHAATSPSEGSMWVRKYGQT
jgi:FkbM family methyltransferase